MLVFARREVSLYGNMIPTRSDDGSLEVLDGNGWRMMLSWRCEDGVPRVRDADLIRQLFSHARFCSAVGAPRHTRSWRCLRSRCVHNYQTITHRLTSQGLYTSSVAWQAGYL